VVDVPKKPLTRSTARRLPWEQTFETLETIPKDEFVDDKVKEITQLQEQLKKAHMVIAQLQRENRELKKFIVEKTIETIQYVAVDKTTPSAAKSKGKEKVMNEDVKKGEAPAARITKSSSRKLQVQEEKTEVDERKHTFNKLRRQLKETHREIFELKQQDEMAKKQMSDLLDIYQPAMNNAKYMFSKSLPLHRKMKNV